MAITLEKLKQDLADIETMDASEKEKELLRDVVQSQIDEREEDPSEPVPAPVETAPVSEVPPVVEEPSAPIEETPVEEAPVEEPATPEAPAEEVPEAPVEETPEAPIEEPVEVPETPIEAGEPTPAPVEPLAVWPADADIKLAADAGGELLDAMDAQVATVYAAKKLGK